MNRPAAFIAVCAFLIAAGVYAGEVLINPRDFQAPALRWEIPPSARFVLPNGLVVYVQSDRELPLVDVSVTVRAGSIYDPADKVGLASLTATTLRTGGIAAPGRVIASDDLDEELEFRAAVVESSADSETATVSASCLAGDADFILQLLFDLLVYPAFEEGKLNLAKDQMSEGIRRQNDTPQAIAWRELPKLVYGSESPWARTPTLATVAAIKRADVIDFHRRFYDPRRAILCVYGDFQQEEMAAKVRRIFGAWRAGTTELPAVEAVKLEFSPGVFLARKQGQSQSMIVMGHLGPRRHAEDYFALTVMNEVLGGSFTSRMVKEIRSDRGLAYGTGTGFVEGTDYGLFYAFAATRADATVTTAAIMRDVIATMRTEPATEEEIARARDSILNRFVFLFDGRGELLNRRASLEFYGYPADYYDRYWDNVAAVTPAEVAAAATKYLHPDGLKVLVVGDPAAFDKPLNSLGEVTEIPLTIK